MTKKKEYYTIKELSELIGKSTQWIYHCMNLDKKNRNYIDSVTIGKLRLITKDEVNRIAEKYATE